MESFLYERIREYEERHWWFQARRDILVAVIRAWGPPGARILDAGCGTGFVAHTLRDRYRLSLTDAAPEAVRFCADRGLPVARASIRQLPFGAETFELVGCFDVLYHRAIWPIESTLRELHRVLKPSGALIAAEPAYQWLFGEADVLDHAERRFGAHELASYLRDAGFTVRQEGYFNTYLAPLIITARMLGRLWSRLRPKRKPSPEFGSVPLGLNRLLAATFRSEKARVLRGGYPFGISVLCVAQK